MTRINCGIEPRELPDKLLIAEHREITRIPNAVRRLKPRTDNLPPTFRLGTGHVKFFYDKLGYLRRRYNALLDECRQRGFRVTDKESAFDGIDSVYFGGYSERAEDRAMLISRIADRGFSLIEEVR